MKPGPEGPLQLQTTQFNFLWSQNVENLLASEFSRFKGTLSKKSSLDGNKKEPEIASEMYFETLKLIVVMNLKDIRTFDTYNATWDNLLRSLDTFIN